MADIVCSSGESGELAPRILSAVVLAALVLAAVSAGRPWFELLLALFALVMAWEWARLCGKGRLGAAGVALMIVAVVVVALASLGRDVAALGSAFAGFFLIHAVVRFADDKVSSWLPLGALYIGVPCLALIWLRNEPPFGREAIFWVLAVVWATDVGAYVAGRLVGGPRLAPRLSPNKTWAGLVGGIAAAALASGVVIVFMGGTPSLWPFILFGGALGAVAQMGDLFESSVKRRFGVKDTSRLIPGHGGVLDRVDGLLAVSPVVALFVVLFGASETSWR